MWKLVLNSIGDDLAGHGTPFPEGGNNFNQQVLIQGIWQAAMSDVKMALSRLLLRYKICELAATVIKVDLCRVVNNTENQNAD